jgi:uncharacterized protein (TIGR00369 family)
MSSFIASAESATFRSVLGMEWARGGRRPHQDMTVTSGIREPDGRLAAGAVAALADSTLGTAAASARDGIDGVVTLGIHADLFDDLPGRGSGLTLRTRKVTVEGHLVWASGELVCSDQVIGTVSWRGLFTAFARRHARLQAVGRPAPPADGPVVGPGSGSALGDGRAGSVDEMLDLSVACRAGGEVAIACRPTAPLASGWGTLHGGVVALIGLRAAHHAVDVTAGPVRPLVIDVEFHRPVPVSTQVGASGGIVHLGRSYSTAEGRVIIADGRLAATARMSVALERR